ncbi:ran GTPase-activating protein 1 [Patella vulgata]|uniref:ran GTPase-activating protein 1 n=1 Tax=Patella vulgata TaxID=6465 RepID=UPI00217F5C3D|nr:ran GTPase-activating protein 1 [Patella vulgata]
MASDSVDKLTEQLAGTTVESSTELVYKRKDATFKLNTAEDAKALVEAIESFDNMKALRLEGNTLGIDAAAAVGEALKKHPEFEKALWSDMFTGRLKTEIPQALKHLGAGIMAAGAQLVELDLSDNAFGPNAMNGLVDFLPSKSCYTLQVLKLNNNGLGITGGKMLAKCLTECYENSLSTGNPLALKVFVSGRNRLENEGTKALSQVFKKLGTLENISMPQNGINAPGISALADALMTNTGLKILNLNDNTLTEKGAKHIAQVLPKLENLEVINFGDCLIRNAGAVEIAKVLTENNNKLKELILSGNEIKQAGANSIIESIEKKEHLVKIDLDANQFGEGGCAVIKGLFEAMNKEDILASLSDDEGSDDEEDDDGDGEEEGEEEEEEEDDDDDDDEYEDIDEIQDSEIQINKDKSVTPQKPKDPSITPQKQIKVSAADFLAFPSPTKLQQMGDERGVAIKHELGDEDKDIEKLVDTIFRISTVVTETDKKTKQAANQCADELLEPVLTDSDSSGSLFTNTFLVKLGVIKGEDKKYKPPEDVSGPLLVLTHIIQQEYVSRFSREILQVFISKPHPVFDKASTARHELLQTLYAF